MSAPLAVTPRELPEIRHQLVAEFTAWTAKRRPRWQATPVGKSMDASIPLVRSLGQAPLYFVTEHFADLMIQAAPSMPDHRVTPQDLPTADGLVFFARTPTPQDVKSYWPGWGCSGFVWATRHDRIYVGKVLHEQRASELHGTPNPVGWPKYLPVVDMHHDVLVPGSLANSAHRLAAAFWNLLRQPLLAAVEEQATPRPERRRLARLGAAHDDPIRTVTLRVSPKLASGSASETEWAHRWMVRGHWRRQWYPSLQDHRPVWIAPHIKGPDDKPLLGGEKVYVAAK